MSLSLIRFTTVDHSVVLVYCCCARCMIICCRVDGGGHATWYLTGRAVHERLSLDRRGQPQWIGTGCRRYRERRGIEWRTARCGQSDGSCRRQPARAEPIPRYLTGKFCEHLGNNIYNGMDAQILRNPTFAVYPFWTGEMSPDGVTAFHSERDQIVAQLKQQASRVGWPKNQLDRLSEAYDDGLACWWIREGDRDSVRVSPDTGPAGQRAQRIEIQEAGQGVGQWIALPLHRTRSYECELLVRSPDTIRRVIVSLRAPESQQPVAQTELQGTVSSQWTSLRGRLQVDAQADADANYRLSLTVDDPAQLVVARLQLWPADHIGGADPDVIAQLRESRLPLLRWPGGNFVSSYHWLDGVGTIDARPTLPNYAWGGVETNLFGTDEFLAFCRAVGCEPMICVNAGNGTPDEAARWIQYCNGSADTPMGELPRPTGTPNRTASNIGRWATSCGVAGSITGQRPPAMSTGSRCSPTRCAPSTQRFSFTSAALLRCGAKSGMTC